MPRDDCSHQRMKFDLSVQTSLMNVTFHLFGVQCEDCERKWDVGELLQAIIKIDKLLVDLKDADDRFDRFQDEFVQPFGELKIRNTKLEAVAQVATLLLKHGEVDLYEDLERTLADLKTDDG